MAEIVAEINWRRGKIGSRTTTEEENGGQRQVVVDNREEKGYRLLAQGLSTFARAKGKADPICKPSEKRERERES